MVAVIGLDVSLTSTGISTSAGESNVFTTPDKFDNSMERYDFILNEVMGVIRDASADDDSTLVLIEGYAFAKRSSHAHAQGELGGILRRGMWLEGFKVVEVPPTSLKKFVTGKGNANKTDMVSSVTLRTCKEWSGKGADDRADAWGLRQMGLAHLGTSAQEWSLANLSALTKIDWE